jgi:hypothetical protein
MKSRITLLALVLISVFVFPAWTSLDEGMWMLDQITKLPLDKMKNNGFELTPEQIYNPDGLSIKDAIILIGGGTASFVSPNGLILTNHHIAFESIVSVSTENEDRLKNGFLAKSYEEEIPVNNVAARLLVQMKDITLEVLSAVSDTMSLETRQKNINDKLREIEKREKGTTDYDCRAVDTFYGLKYYLFIYEVIEDIRLVYCPPNDIGNFGGEVDNWIWPRHTGDFAFWRAYVSPNGKGVKYSKENLPYKPKKFLPLSSKGFEEGSFMMIMGYPGRTYRYRTSYDVELAYNEVLPYTADIYKTQIDAVHSFTKTDRSKELQYAGFLQGIENTQKKFLGIEAGIKRTGLIQIKRNEEEEFLRYTMSDLDLNLKYGTVLIEMKRLIDELSQYNKKRILFGSINRSCEILKIARRFKDFVNNPTRIVDGKKPLHTETDYSTMKTYLADVYKGFNNDIDKELLTQLLLKAAELPAIQRIVAIDKIFGSKTGDKRNKSIREFVDDLYSETKLTSQEKAEKFLKEEDDDILDDEFVKFVQKLDKEDAVIKERYTKYETEIGAMRTKLMEALIHWKGDGFYPEANRTMRFTYGTVKPFTPKDAVTFDYVTSLAGIIEKESSEDPFKVPPKLKELWEKKDFGNYTDKHINDIPVAFIANVDVTGGNSGSPIINGKGEVAGCSFDGNWESVVGDYYFDEPMNRTINVDSRYILFILDKFADAQNLLQEMVIK